jgi:phage-related protein
MSIEYPVKVKFTYDNSELKKVQDKVSTKVSAKSSGSQTITGESKELKQLGESGKGQKSLLVGILGKLVGIGALLSSLQAILEPLLKTIQILVFVAVASIIKRLKEIGQAFVDLFQGDIVGFLKNLIGPGMFDFITAWLEEGWAIMKDVGKWIYTNIIEPGWEVLKGVGQWIYDTILSPGWESLKSVSKWVYDNIISPGWESLKSVGMWIQDNVIAPGWEVLKTVGSWIMDNVIIPSWSTLSSIGTWIWENVITPGFEAVLSFGGWIWEQIIKPGFGLLSDVGDQIWTMLKSYLKFLGDIASRIWNLIRPYFEVLHDIGDKIWAIIRRALRSLISPSSKKKVEDSTEPVQLGSEAFGGMIPETGLYQLHAGEQVSRGNTVSTVNNNKPTINVYVQGGANTNIATEVARKLSNELYAYCRG